MYQQIMLVGHLGSEVEMRYTPFGVPVASFNLAVNKSWVGQDGQRQEKTTWFRVTAWNKQGENAAQYLAKGRQVMVVGEVEEARPWTDRDGNQRASLEVTAQVIKYLGGGRDESGEGKAKPATTQAPQREDIEIPF